MKTTNLFYAALFATVVVTSNAQNDSTAKQGNFLPKSASGNSIKGKVHNKLHHFYYGDSTTTFHIGWENGRVPEFSNAYTLHRHEVRLNVLGRSSYAIGNRFEVSSYLPLNIIARNASLKYRFLDRRNFASAVEFGTARGMFPVSMATGILLPGAVMGAGTMGFVKGSDKYLKLFLSWHPTEKLTISGRGSISFLKVGYTGLAGLVGVGGEGVVAGILPINVKHRFNYYMGGFETDYVINKKNAIVFNSSVGGFKGGKKQLMISSLGWTHANTHFHYTVGLYNVLDPPKFEMWKDEKSKMPVGPYANVYWIFNNRVKTHAR